MNNSIPLYLPKNIDVMAEFEERNRKRHAIQEREEYRAALEKLLYNERNAYLEQHSNCPLCSGILYRNGSIKVHVLIKSGNTEIRIPKLICSNCKMIIEFDTFVPDNLVSALLMEKISDLSIKMSFQEVEESLYIQHGIRLSASSIWRHMQKECESMEDVVKLYSDQMKEAMRMPPNLTGEKQKIIIIGIDGGHVSLWHNKHSFEMKAVTLCHGVSRDSSKRGTLINRVGYASNANGNDFCFDASALAYMHGLDKDTLCIIVSDGATWIRKGVRDWFPSAIHVLDIFHLKLHINRLFGKECIGYDKETLDDIIQSISNYNPNELIEKISSWNAPIDKLDKQRELLYYIKANRQLIKNHLHTSMHGSGMIEKGVDLMISRRLKLRGMSWTKQGSSHLMKMRLLKYNNQWSTYWNMRKGYKMIA
jgi:hypothetical protein